MHRSNGRSTLCQIGSSRRRIRGYPRRGGLFEGKHVPVTTILCPALDQESVVQLLLQKFRAQVRLSGERTAWRALTAEFSTGGRLQIACLTAASDREKFHALKRDLAAQVLAVEGVEPTHRRFLSGACLAAPVLLSVTPDPPIDHHGDPRLQVPLEITAANCGLLHVRDGFYDGAGELLLNAEGHVDAVPAQDIIGAFLKLDSWPAASANPQPGGSPPRPRPAKLRSPELSIDFAALRANVDNYLRGPGKQRLDDLGLPGAVTAVVWLLGLVVAIVQLLSIVWFSLGLKTLQVLFTPGAFTHPGNKLAAHPELLQPIVLAGIIKGPSGHALALGSFDPATQSDFELLADKARELGQLYSQGSTDPRDAEMVTLLKDDVYRPDRRRKVPARHAAGRDLTLFDVEIGSNWQHGEAYGGVFYLFAAARDEDGGGIVQLPWNLTTIEPRWMPAPVTSVQAELASAAPQRVVPAASQGWRPYQRAAILAGAGVALIVGLIVGFNWLVQAVVQPQRPARVAAAPKTPGPPLSFRKWAYPWDENGKQGYFVDLGERWEEWKEDKQEPSGFKLFAVYSTVEKTSEHIEIVRVGQPPLWVRMRKHEAHWSWDKKKWNLTGYGGPE